MYPPVVGGLRTEGELLLYEFSNTASLRRMILHVLLAAFLARSSYTLSRQWEWTSSNVDAPCLDHDVLYVFSNRLGLRGYMALDEGECALVNV